jgi:septum formation protein
LNRDECNKKEGESQVARVEKLILASASPRRSEILTIAGWPFEAIPADIDEQVKDSEDPVSYVERLAFEKAHTIAGRAVSGLVLGVDTIVLLDGRIIGKPESKDDAKSMLRDLRNRWHEVLSGVALLRAGTERKIITHQRTRVHFTDFSDSDIEWYVGTGEPMDKAGAYAIQGKGAIFVDRIEGDYWNIVGLPIQLVYKISSDL